MAQYLRAKKKKRRVPLVKRKKIDDLQSFWETRILEAEVVKHRWKERFGVDLLEKAYEGGVKPESWESDDWFTLNLLFESVKVLKRNICPDRLEVRMKLAKSFVADAESIMRMQQIIYIRKAIVQYLMDDLRLSGEGQLAYLNSLWQFGVLKVGYSAEIESNPNAGGLVFNKSGQIVYNSETMEPEIEDDEQVVEEQFLIDQVDPECFLVDRYCQNSIDKTGAWVAQKVFCPVEKVMENPDYDWKAVQDLEPSALEDAEKIYLGRDEGYLNPFHWDTGTELPENELLVLYEIYDLEQKKILTLARGGRELIRKPQDLPPGIALHPFITLKFNERRGSFYPIPGIYNWLGPYMEYNITRNQMAQHRKRYNRKYLYDANKIEPEEIEKLENPYDGVMAKATGAGAVEPIKDAPVDSALYFDTTQLRSEFKEISGVGTLQRGQVGAESATEAEIVERRAREGEIDEHETMMKFLSEAAKKLHDCVEANLTQEGAISITGPYGQLFVPFGPEFFEKIAGEIFFEVTAEEQSRVTLQVERAQLLQLLEVVGNNPWIAADPVMLRAVFEKFPALAGNEALIASFARFGMAMVNLQMVSQMQGGGGAGQGSSSTGEVAQNSRKVATGR